MVPKENKQLLKDGNAERSLIMTSFLKGWEIRVEMVKIQEVLVPNDSLSNVEGEGLQSRERPEDLLLWAKSILEARSMELDNVWMVD